MQLPKLRSCGGWVTAGCRRNALVHSVPFCPFLQSILPKTAQKTSKKFKKSSKTVCKVSVRCYIISLLRLKRGCSEVDNVPASAECCEERFWKKIQKIFKIRFASSQKRCYIIKPIFSGVLEWVPWLIENWIVRCNRKHRDVLNNYIEITSSLLQKSQ